MAASTSTTLTIRIDEFLKRRLRAAAKKERRTVTSYVVVAVEDKMSDRKGGK